MSLQSSLVARSRESPRTRFDLDQVFQPFCPLYRRALCSGTGWKPDLCNVDFLQHTRGIATRPNCRQCYTVTELSSVPAEWFCRGIRRVQRDDDELVPDRKSTRLNSSHL